MELNRTNYYYFYSFSYSKYYFLGRRSFTWNGPLPLVTITEPELIREVLMKIDKFHKPVTPVLNTLAPSLVMLEG